MGGYVNRDEGGWTELRVHGVSGTPPEAMLGHPHVVRVAGDTQAGFYRRRWEAQSVAADNAEARLEAYSWGGLTAGSGQRALWLLLTPFLLVNVAFWAQPFTGMNPGRSVIVVRRVGEAVQRLFALSITLTLMLAAVAVSMDFVGWQCVRPDDAPSCTGTVSWLSFLSWDWLDQPGRRLALTAAVPLAVVVLLWWLANKSWLDNEAVRVPHATPTVQRTPLEDRRMWSGTGPVRRLRSVHVTVAFAAVGMFLLAPFAGEWAAFDALTRGAELPDWNAMAAEGLLAVTLLLLLSGVVLLFMPVMSDRVRPGKEERPGHVDAYTFLPWLALAIDLAALPLMSFTGLEPTEPPGVTRAPLPWISAWVHLVIGVQVVLLALMLLVLWALRRHAHGAPSVQPLAADGEQVTTSPAWFGFATAGLMMLGSALAGGYAAGLVLAVAHVLGKPTPADQGPDHIVAPMPYFWAAALTVPIAVWGGGLGIAYLVRRRRAVSSMLEKVAQAYTETLVTANARRAREIAKTWVRAKVSDVGRILVGIFVLWIAAVMGIGGILYLRDPRWIYDVHPWMFNVGDVLVGAFVAALLYVGRQAYRNQDFRRRVGVLWDLGTFWPRATHPLAPPCYAERAVPELIDRITHLGVKRQGWVLLSCHSQGSVIGAAVVMQLAYEESARVALLTYGSPLRRLYSRFFPAYFGVEALLRAGAFLVGEPLSQIPDEARTRWPWRNLHRPSDPIGGPTLVTYPAQEPPDLDADTADVDRQLIDPAFPKRPGDNAYPETYGHSYYPDDDVYAAAVDRVKELRLAEPPEGEGLPPAGAVIAEAGA